MSEEDSTPTYQPLVFEDTPCVANVRAAAARILGWYFGQPMSLQGWRDAGWLVAQWRDRKGVQQISRPFRFETFCEHLSAKAAFEPAVWNLPLLLSGWLDASIEVAQPFQIMNAEKPGEGLVFLYPSAISDSFPVSPQLDREGRAFSSLQLPLLQSLLELRTRLVATSSQLFSGNDWLRDLFSYLSTAVACVDNTLHQLYYRAKYEGGEHGWTFDATKLGSTHGQRIRDKLAWIRLITGTPLDSCPAAVEGFIELKNVRNHIAHFDPPVLAFTIEDVAKWLNRGHDVAIMLADIRRILKEPPCGPLIQLLVAPNVTFVPAHRHQRRPAQPPHVGYASSCWRERSQ